MLWKYSPGTEKAWKGIKKTLGQYALASSQVKEQLQVHPQLPGSLAGSAALARRGLRAPRAGSCGTPGAMEGTSQLRFAEQPPCQTPSTPALAAPRARGFGARRKGGGAGVGWGEWPFCGFGGFFPSFLLQSKWAQRLPWEGGGKPWLFSQSSPTKGRGEAGRDGAVGGRG